MSEVKAKKIKTIPPEKALEQFLDATHRASLSHYYSVGRTLVNYNEDGYLILAVPDAELMKIILDQTINQKTDIIKEYVEEGSRIKAKYFSYGSRMEEDGWVSLVNNTDLFDGKTIPISIPDREFPIILSKAFLPLKLKKAEFNSIDIKLFREPKSYIIGIRKRFELVPEHGFYILRLFQVI